jgi:predicted outer membrane repeat protein
MMKKIVILMIISACALSVSANTHFDIQSGINLMADNSVLYVSPDGTGDGSSPNSPLGSTKEALNKSKAGGTIKVLKGLYSGDKHTGLMIDRNISIEGDIDAVFDGEGKNFIFMANGQGLNVSVSNITFRNAKSEHGPGYHGYASVNYLKNCVFEDNNANTGAGATGFSNAVAILENCTFKGNHAENFAGATSSWVGSNVTIIKCIYENNTVGENGACIFAKGSHFTSINSTFKDNKGDSGIIYADENAEVNIINTTFTDNNVKLAGGAIYVLSSNLNVNNCDFRNNRASNGGSIDIDGKSSANIDSCNFINNSAEVDGGAVSIKDGQISINNSNFTDNIAKVRGGAIYNYMGKLSVDNSNFDSNSQTDKSDLYYYGGGVIFNEFGNNLAIKSSNFTNNRAVKGGGAIWNVDGTNFTIQDSIFTKNSAGYGSVIQNDYGDNLTIKNTNFDSNNAGQTGAIYLGSAYSSTHESNVFIINSNFVNNVAGGWGGAIAVVSSQYNVNVIGSKFDSNSAFRGGAIMVDGGSLIVSAASSFTNNFASYEGGAIDNLWGGKSTVSDDTFFSNNKPNDIGY